MEILIAILGIVAVFIIVLVAKSIVMQLKSRKLGTRKQNVSEEKAMEYASDLGKMIRCETVSVDGSYDDTEFKKLRDVMAELFPLVHEKAEKMTFGDDCWIYKIKGKDESRNIMVMSHHDVVAVEGEWKHPGFCGEVFDGAIWGRGTVDTKTPLFSEFQALEELLAEGYEPECNLYIGSSHNEEIGGDGIPLALEYFKKQGITFETILDEGGAVIAPPLAGIKCNCAMLAVHEKGRCTLELQTVDGGGHKGLAASNSSPVTRMAAFITEVNGDNVFIRRLHPQVKQMFLHLAPYCPAPLKLVFANLWCFEKILIKIIPKMNAQAASMLGTTCTFNEISKEKSAKICKSKIFLRSVDKQDFEKDVAKIKEIAKKYDVEVIDTEDNYHYNPANMDSKAFSYTKSCINEIFPEVGVAPYILPAGTDARHLCEICDCVIRFAPIEMNDQQFASVHSENENMCVESVGNAVAFYKLYLKNYK